MSLNNRGRHRKGQGGEGVTLPGSRRNTFNRGDLVKSWNALSDAGREIYHYNFEIYVKDKK